MTETVETPWNGNEQIAMLIYPGMTALDLIGPHNFFGRLSGATILLVSESLEPVTIRHQRLHRLTHPWSSRTPKRLQGDFPLGCQARSLEIRRDSNASSRGT